jgi:hypothetical protein
LFLNVLVLTKNWQVYAEVTKSEVSMSKYTLYDSEWKFLRLLTGVLESFAMVTKWVSAEKSPSAGMAFALYEYLMRQMEGKA